MFTKSLISVIIDDTGTDGDVVTVSFGTPHGVIEIMGEVKVFTNALLKVENAHLQGPGARPMSRAKLQLLGDVLMEKLNVIRIEIQGAPRSTGAKTRQKPIYFRHIC